MLFRAWWQPTNQPGEPRASLLVEHWAKQTFAIVTRREKLALLQLLIFLAGPICFLLQLQLLIFLVAQFLVKSSAACKLFSKLTHFHLWFVFIDLFFRAKKNPTNAGKSLFQSYLLFLLLVAKRCTVASCVDFSFLISDDNHVVNLITMFTNLPYVGFKLVW